MTRYWMDSLTTTDRLGRRTKVNLIVDGAGDRPRFYGFPDRMQSLLWMRAQPGYVRVTL